MREGPKGRLLDGGRRLHLSHGPIDLIVEAFGDEPEIEASYRQARARFETVLSELVGELELLRQPVSDRSPRFGGRVGARMRVAVWPHREAWITPMAAVAGAVADEILAAMLERRTLAKAYVNNSGDIALHVGPGETLRLGLVSLLHRPEINNVAVISPEHGIGGVATSGWRGRSHSLGIADSVTVLASSAAQADAAATLIANSVDADHENIERAPAKQLAEDSDLGDRLVTTAVGPLDVQTVETALESGVHTAERIIAGGLIAGASLTLSGVTRSRGVAQALLQNASA